MLTLAEIWKSYDSTEVLAGPSWTVLPGSVSLLVGPSGAGKSTLLRVAAAIEQPDRGLVEFAGNSLGSSAARDEIWPDLTVVFQQLFLWPHLTLRQNIELPSARRGLSTARLEQFAQELDLSHLMDRYPNQVSVGQRQRAAVARALLLQPKILLLDEITSSLDAEQIERILEVLKVYLQSGGGIGAITHQLGFARTLLRQSAESTFLFLDCGKGLESGGMVEFDAPATTRFSEFRQAMQRASWGEI